MPLKLKTLPPGSQCCDLAHIDRHLNFLSPVKPAQKLPEKATGFTVVSLSC